VREKVSASAPVHINSHKYRSVQAIVLIKNCFYKARCGDDEAFGEAFYRCSDLANESGKGYSQPSSYNYSASRVKVLT